MALCSGQTLDSLIATALRNNSQLKSYEYQASAARAKIWQAVSLDAPMVGIEYMQAPISSFPDPGKDQMEKDFFVQQMIMFPGKTLAMRSMASNNAAMMKQVYKAQERKVIRDVKAAYYMLYFTRQKKRLSDENLGLMKDFIQIARKMYETGMSLQIDILRAQTELANLQNQQIDQEQELESSVEMLGVLIGQPVDSAVVIADEIYIDMPQLSYVAIDTIIEQNRPDLQSMKYAVKMNKASALSAKLGYLPDIMLQGRYKVITGDPQRYWSLMLGFTIPLVPWSAGKSIGLAAENNNNAKKTESEYANMRNMAQYEAHTALNKIQAYHEQIIRFQNSIIPQAKQTMQSTLTAYQNGKTEFLMVIDAYKMQLMSRLDYNMAIMNYMTAQADLEQAVGLDIKDILSRLNK